MDIGKMINQRRLELGLTLEEVGNIVGVSKSTVKKWEDGFISNMKRDKISLLAKALKMNPVSFITGEKTNANETITPLPQENVFMVPLFESVSAGFGAYANEVCQDFIPTFINTSKEKDLYLWIKVQGDSMSPRIEDGDEILVRKQSSVDSGSIAVVYVEEDALVKKIIYTVDTIELHSFNPYYPPIIFKGADIKKIKILGLVKKISRNV